MIKDKKPKIEIKPSNEGKFTDFCKAKGYDGVTSGCISDGKKSALARIRKRATFAANARKWNKG